MGWKKQQQKKASEASNFHTLGEKNQQQVRQIKKVHKLQRKEKIPQRQLNLAYTSTTCRMELNENTTTNRTYLIWLPLVGYMFKWNSPK